MSKKAAMALMMGMVAALQPPGSGERTQIKSHKIVTKQVEEQLSKQKLQKMKGKKNRKNRGRNRK